MKRKVAQIGPSTLMVSLPTAWVKENRIKKGDELDVLLGNKEINFSLGEKKKHSKEITVDISKYDRYFLDRKMTVLYRNNYDQIILTYNTKELNNYKGEKYNIQNYLQKLSKRFIGVEIISQTDKKTELACFILKDLENVKAIEKRIYFLLRETMNNLMEAIENDFSEFDKVVYDHHDNIVKFINYYLRIIDRLSIDEDVKKQVYAFYVLMDKIVDKIRHISNKVQIYGCTKKVKLFLAEIFDLFYYSFDNFYKIKIDTELIKKRYDLNKRIDKEEFTMKEMKVMKETDLLMNAINDFSETILLKQLMEKDQL